MPDVRLSHPDKVLFPDDGLTKADLAGHYERVAERMLPHLRDRPLSLQVYPGGIGKRGHFLKQIPDYFPDWIQRAELPKHGGTVTHMVAQDADALRMLAQHNAITPHVPTARIDRPDRPDRVILDFDPEGEDDWEVILAGARAAAERLRDAGLEPFAMVTGSRGLHVVAPLRREADYPDVLEMAKDLAAALVADAPDALTVKFKKEQREGRVYVDYLRNRKAHTAVAPYAVRAKPRAPVATPVTWEELGGVTSQRWTLRDMAERLSEADPWAAFSSAAASPRSAARKLADAAP
ncbi:MAG: bifunctional non-ous end joining protein LigD [Solirubrobacteraceae bacterium]|nr:bifunctional non-ous end joining protein LigD [Solirubrobacteraceae bacterium]